MRRALLVLGVCTIAPLGTTRSLPTPDCTPTATPYFEFQVEFRAAFIGDSAVSPRPSARREAIAGNELALVQFIVDTLGRPDSTSFKVLSARDVALPDDARRVLTQWRYRPARIGTCLVRQIVQTPLER